MDEHFKEQIISEGQLLSDMAGNIVETPVVNVEVNEPVANVPTDAQPQPSGRVAIGDIIPAAMIISLADSAMSGLSTGMLNKYGYRVKRSEMQLTTSEQKAIEPVLETCLKTVNVNFSNPWEALAYTVIGVYAMKVIAIISTKERETTPAPQDEARPASADKKRVRRTKAEIEADKLNSISNG